MRPVIPKARAFSSGPRGLARSTEPSFLHAASKGATFDPADGSRSIPELLIPTRSSLPAMTPIPEKQLRNPPVINRALWPVTCH